MTVELTTAIQLDEAGAGTPLLVLHGGGGPATVQGLAASLAGSADSPRRVITPTHPGWNGTERLAEVRTVADLARHYLDLLAQRDLSEVVVIGSSIGGWLAAEMAVQDAAGEHRVTSAVLIDAGGIEVPGEPIRDFFSLDPQGIAEHSFYDSARFYRDPATITTEQMAAQAANMATMSDLTAGGVMSDPTLQDKLGSIGARTLVIWGDSDGIFTPDYGRAYAAAVPGAEFVLIEHAGHLPQLERPDLTLAAIHQFLTPSQRFGV